MSNPEVTGACSCRAVRFHVTGQPLVVHCCHCRYCQRETGSAFVVNALFEAERVELEGPPLDVVLTPSASGKGQKIHRCPSCRVALFSNYAQAGDAMRFVRVGTLDLPDVFAPDVHIYTSTKQPWLTLPAGVPAFEAFYDPKQVWSAESQLRWQALRSRAT
jgi:hypothetical protein